MSCRPPSSQIFTSESPSTFVRVSVLSRRYREQPGGLQLGLLPFPFGVGAPGDAGAGAETQDAFGAVVPEGADADGELRRGAVGVDPADAAAVGAAGCGLQSLDDGQGAGFGGAGDG